MWLDIEILKDLINEFGGEIKFETPVTVKLTPHSHPMRARSVRIEGGVIISGGDISIEVSEPGPLCNSLIQRLKIMQIK